ncbi:MAG: hypothetical protein V4638_02020 [Bacteroidota bacterium]
MKQIVFVFFLMISIVCFGQDNKQFTLNSEQYTFYVDEEWDEWHKATNVFIFNINENGDMQHFDHFGDKFIYISTSAFKKEKKNGLEFQTKNFIDDEGVPFTLHLFEDEKLGVQFLYDDGDIIVRYVK